MLATPATLNSHDARRREDDTRRSPRILLSLAYTLGLLTVMSGVCAALLSLMFWSLRSDAPSAVRAGSGAAVNVEAILASEAYISGKQHFINTCTGCHQENGRGLPGLGLNIIPSNFVASASDAELERFIRSGRPVSDPNNITGVDMPPRGGNPALQPDHIRDIVAYIRGLEAQHNAAGM